MSERSARLKEVALLFTRLGFTAFGGPAAHVAMIEDEVVEGPYEKRIASWGAAGYNGLRL
jgi:chromate transport protein ChrA